MMIFPKNIKWAAAAAAAAGVVVVVVVEEELSPFSYNRASQGIGLEKQPKGSLPYDIPLNPGWFIGIPIMVYYKPYIYICLGSKISYIP